MFNNLINVNKNNINNNNNNNNFIELDFLKNPNNHP
jgi:hypothetical protein